MRQFFMWTKLCAAFLLYTLAGCAGVPTIAPLADGSYPMKPNETVAIGGGALSIKFPGSYKPKAGDTITVLGAGRLQGTFTTITVAGFAKVTPTYSGTTLTLTVTN